MPGSGDWPRQERRSEDNMEPCPNPKCDRGLIWIETYISWASNDPQESVHREYISYPQQCPVCNGTGVVEDVQAEAEG
jgi:hypothetical protein